MSDFLDLYKLQLTSNPYSAVRVINETLQSSPECQLPTDVPLNLNLTPVSVTLPPLECNFALDTPLVPVPTPCLPHVLGGLTVTSCDDTKITFTESESDPVRFERINDCDFSLNGTLNVCTTLCGNYTVEDDMYIIKREPPKVPPNPPFYIPGVTEEVTDPSLSIIFPFSASFSPSECKFTFSGGITLPCSDFTVENLVTLHSYERVGDVPVPTTLTPPFSFEFHGDVCKFSLAGDIQLPLESVCTEKINFTGTAELTTDNIEHILITGTPITLTQDPDGCGATLSGGQNIELDMECWSVTASPTTTELTTYSLTTTSTNTESLTTTSLSVTSISPGLLIDETSTGIAVVKNGCEFSLEGSLVLDLDPSLASFPYKLTPNCDVSGVKVAPGTISDDHGTTLWPTIGGVPINAISPLLIGCGTGDIILSFSIDLTSMNLGTETNPVYVIASARLATTPPPAIDLYASAPPTVEASVDGTTGACTQGNYFITLGSVASDGSCCTVTGQAVNQSIRLSSCFGAQTAQSYGEGGGLILVKLGETLEIKWW